MFGEISQGFISHSPLFHHGAHYSPKPLASEFPVNKYQNSADLVYKVHSISELVNYQYISEEGEKLGVALQDIANCPIVSVDCEGEELGRNGSLSLIQIATESKVYLFDVLSLGESLFKNGLKFILESPIPTKVFYDCRRDSDILWHQYQVRLKGVLDVSLTEVFYRWAFGLGSPRYLKGYKRSVESYLLIQNPHFSQIKESVSARMSNGDTKFWMQRPLTRDMMDYAAYDVKYLRELHFVLTQSMSTQNIRSIYGASTKFVAMERDADEMAFARNSPKWAEISPSLFSIQ